jgi:hypothetical protein
MIRIEIIGLPSGEIMIITENQLKALKEDELVLKVKRFKGMELNKYCFDDKNLPIVRMVAIINSY